VRKRVCAERAPNGSFICYSEEPNGEKSEIKIYEEYLEDVLYSILNPLRNLKDVVEEIEKNNEPGSIFYLLHDMLREADIQINELSEIIGKIGIIKVYRCSECQSGIKEGSFLWASVSRLKE